MGQEHAISLKVLITHSVFFSWLDIYFLCGLVFLAGEHIPKGEKGVLVVPRDV